jgi:ParB-like chromosome segregation protein Spo0J
MTDIKEFAPLAQGRNTIEPHPLANLFPLMEGAEFDEFVVDIKTNGLHEPIVLFDGKILDGRNRYRACLAADVEPDVIDGDGWIDDPATYVISANIRRRHLNTEQRAEFLAKIIARTPEKSDRQLGKELGVDGKTVARARAKGEDAWRVSKTTSSIR